MFIDVLLFKEEKQTLENGCNVRYVEHHTNVMTQRKKRKEKRKKKKLGVRCVVLGRMQYRMSCS